MLRRPDWIPEAMALCPKEAAKVKQLTAALQALPQSASVELFIGTYEELLRARDVLYGAWIAQQQDEETPPRAPSESAYLGHDPVDSGARHAESRRAPRGAPGGIA